jgi:hypothetical protein
MDYLMHKEIMMLLANLIKRLSPINVNNQKTWEIVSSKCIKQKVVQQLTEKGLIQAIDRLAYEIAQDGNWRALSELSDEECDKILNKKIQQMDDIINVIALASGIHPTSIDFVVGMRTDYYIDIYIDTIDGEHK